METKTIVLGGNHHNTLGVVRSLGQSNVHPIVYIPDKNLHKSFVFKSRYVSESYVFHDYDECIEHLVHHFHAEDNKPVVICTSDHAISCVDKNYNRLKDLFCLPGCGKQGVLNQLMNKEVMGDLAKRVGFTLPNHCIVNGDKIPDNINYPCITKPLSSVAGHKSDIHICKNVDDLINALKDKNKDDITQIQDYIDIEFEYQLIGCSLNGGSNLIIPGYTRIIRSEKGSNTGFLEYRPIQELDYDDKKCTEFIKACNYSGLFSLEFIRGKDGCDYFLEINFRNDGNAFAVTGAGVNLPIIWVKFCSGESIENELKNAVKSIYVMPEFMDYVHVLKKRISLSLWLKDVRRTECFFYYNKKDMSPFWCKLRETIKVAGKSGIKKIFC